jgi:uracil-DNA glycosylase
MMPNWNNLFSSTTAPAKKGKSKRMSCLDCGLDQGCNSSKMKAHGKGNKSVVWVGEAPGEVEDETGRQWQGKVGKALRRTLLKYDFDLFEDAVCINSINCRPPDNRAPSPQEIACCRSNVMSVINEVKPELIVLAGASAVESVVGSRISDNKEIKMGLWRGWTIPDRELQAWVCPVFHQSYVERSNSDDMPQVETVYLQDLERALGCLERKFPTPRDERECIQILMDEDEIRTALKKLMEDEPEFLAFDYETTGLKPYAPKHKIVCVSLAWDKNHAVSFPMPKEGKNLSRLLRILEHPRIKKIAQNMQFEWTWTKHLYDVSVEPWAWDTMLATHILDNRRGVTGLKFQAYAQFGVADYNSKIQPFLEGVGKSINAHNRVMDLINKEPNGEKRLLTYCGMDALLEFRLAMKQMRRVVKSFDEQMAVASGLPIRFITGKPEVPDKDMWNEHIHPLVPRTRMHEGGK